MATLGGYAQKQSVPVSSQMVSTAVPFIEVSGTATLNIVPDRITVEIGMEEYFKYKMFGDSTLVKIADIENGVRKTLSDAGIPNSAISVADIGNYRDRYSSDKFKMAKRLTAIVTGLSQLNAISESLGNEGINSFQITNMDNADMESFNRKGLKAALDAARQKAEFIAENENLTISTPLEIVETTQMPYTMPIYSNAAYNNGLGMDDMRRIIRQYSVKVKYAFISK